MILKIILIILGIIVGYLIFMVVIGVRILRRFVHFPAPFFVGYFLDSNFRRRLQPPDKLIKRSGISPNMTILEIGCGSGAYTTLIARSVGEQGRVYALDIQSTMLKQFRNKLDTEENKDIHNVAPILGNAYELPFENHAIDLVCMITVLQEIPDRLKALKEVMRVLKPKGILAVTEFLPDPDYPLKKTTKRIVTSAGFSIDKENGDLWNYTIRFKVPG
jgi:ubiquinone/menaquinone biosynthesis C-methylase UbiE